MWFYSEAQQGVANMAFFGVARLISNCLTLAGDE